MSANVVQTNFMAACSQVVSVPASTVGASPSCIYRPARAVVGAFPATPARLRRDAFSPSRARRVQTRVQQHCIGHSSLLAFGCYLLSLLVLVSFLVVVSLS
jgi:hypothetical protein